VEAHFCFATPAEGAASIGGMIGISRLLAMVPARPPQAQWSPRASFLFIAGFNLVAWSAIIAVVRLLAG